MTGFIGFKSFPEFNTYLTFVLLGMSIMMVPSAITSAPGFVAKYYEYATGIPDVECEKPYFWTNANTFYNVGTYVMQVIMELFCLTPTMRKIPLEVRLYIGLTIPFLEMLLFIVVPAAKVPTQDGAIAVLMVVAVMGGFSKALVDSTSNALVGPFPTKFMNGEQWGLTVVALFMSLVQIILKAAMGTSFDEVLNQARIYFGIGMAIQIISLVQMAIMHRNPFAQKYVAEFRVRANKRRGIVDEAEMEDGVNASEPVAEPTEGCIANDVAADSNEAAGKCLEEDDQVRAVGRSDDVTDENGHTIQGNAAVLRAIGDADRMVDLDQNGNLTSSDQMLRVSLFNVFKCVWPMLSCVFLVFFTSLFLFPGLFFRIDFNSEWFGTIVVLLFNLGDFVSRIVLMIRPLRPSPMTVIAGTFCRLLVIPLLVLCVRGTIPGHWMPYILITIIGLTNGYFGTMACIHCPRTPTLRLAGERSLAAMLSGVFLMFGLCAGSNFALLLNLTI